MFAPYNHFKKEDKRLIAIKQAINCWKRSNTGSYDSRQKFAMSMEKKRWRVLGSGAYKTCLAKYGIAIKFAGDPKYKEAVCEVEREVEQWESAPEQFRKKHLPKVYDYIDGLLIQEKVYKGCEEIGDCEKLNKVKQDLDNLYDCDFNHGHSKGGAIKFFDWVLHRTWEMVEDTEMINRL